jgi:hypothetical protein
VPLCEVAKCQLYKVAKTVPDIQLCDMVRPTLDYTIARSRLCVSYNNEV